MVYRFSKDIYTKDALIKAAYTFTDKSYLHLDVDVNNYIVTIESKDEADVVTEKEFQNALLAEMVRLSIEKRTKNVRELILARAFSSTVIDNIKVEEPEDIDCDIDNILTDWFEKDE